MHSRQLAGLRLGLILLMAVAWIVAGAALCVIVGGGLVLWKAQDRLTPELVAAMIVIVFSFYFNAVNTASSATIAAIAATQAVLSTLNGKTDADQNGTEKLHTPGD